MSEIDDGHLIKAAKNNNMDAANDAIAAGANAHARDNAALIGALRNDHYDIALHLIRHGADLHANDDEAILIAAKSGSLSFFNSLVSLGADPLFVSKENPRATPFAYAVEHGAGGNEILYSLLDLGADPNVNHGNLIAVVSKSGDLKLLQAMVERGADLAKYGGKALCDAYAYKQEAVVDYFLNAGVDPHFNHEQLLGQAIYNNDDAFAITLLNRGADPNGNEGQPLRYCILRSNYDMANRLFSFGAKVSHIDVEVAASNGDMKMLDILFANGADVTSKDNKALAAAAMAKEVAVVDFLISKGADPHADNEAAMRLYSKKNQFEKVKNLIKEGADPRIMNSVILRDALTHENNAAVLYLLDGDIFEPSQGVGIIRVLVNHGETKRAIALIEQHNISLFTPVPYWLLQAGIAAKQADIVRYATKDGNLPQKEADKMLVLAANTGDVEIGKILIGMGAGDSAREYAAFRNAAKGGHTPFLKLLYASLEPYRYTADLLNEALEGQHARTAQFLFNKMEDAHQVLFSEFKNGGRTQTLRSILSLKLASKNIPRL